MLERCCIPHSEILNIDQTSLKYVSVGNFTLAKKGTKSVIVENSKSQFTTNQKGLLIMNVFTGQTTFDIHAAFNKNQICLVKVPANMIRFQQQPDLTVNRYAKEFMKYKFNS